MYGDLPAFLSNFWITGVEWFGDKQGDNEGKWKRMLFYHWGNLTEEQRMRTVVRMMGGKRGWFSPDGNYIYLLQAGEGSEEPGKKPNFLTVDLNMLRISWEIHVAVTCFSATGSIMDGANITPADTSTDNIPKR